MPQTIRESFRSSRDPSATERPLLGGENGAGPEASEDPGATGESPITHEEMGSGDLVEFDEPTGTGIDRIMLLEATHTSSHASERRAERRGRDRDRGRPRRGGRR